MRTIHLAGQITQIAGSTQFVYIDCSWFGSGVILVSVVAVVAPFPTSTLLDLAALERPDPMCG